MKTYNEKSKEGYFLDVDIQYPEYLYNIINDLPFLPETMKIEKSEKLLTNLHNKSEYVIHKTHNINLKKKKQKLILKKTFSN